MTARLSRLWLDLASGLWFVPALVVTASILVGFAMVELDEELALANDSFVFKGDASAARTVLSVVAGSIITVAALTLSITVVVLQLASSQFSPRVLRTFFGDRLTQLTVGTFVGVFAYAVMVLRAVGSASEGGGFVPRLSITLASALGLAAVVLLIVFIHHVSQLIQVSHVTAEIARQTLGRLDALYPEQHGRTAVDEDESVLRRWRADEPGRVLPHGPGYVLRVDLEALSGLEQPPERIAVLVEPGDFASLEQPLAELWPAHDAERLERAVQRAVTIAEERDLDQDLGFGLRQLADIAVRALSPGINDPTTAVTCVGYIRSVLVRLAGRRFPGRLQRTQGGPEVYASRRDFAAYLAYLHEVGRHARGEMRVVGAVLGALRAIAAEAAGHGAASRAAAALEVAALLAAQARAEVASEHDRTQIERLLGAVEAPASAAAEHS